MPSRDTKKQSKKSGVIRKKRVTKRKVIVVPDDLFEETLADVYGSPVSAGTPVTPTVQVERMVNCSAKEVSPVIKRRGRPAGSKNVKKTVGEKGEKVVLRVRKFGNPNFRGTGRKKLEYKRIPDSGKRNVSGRGKLKTLIKMMLIYNKCIDRPIYFETLCPKGNVIRFVTDGAGDMIHSAYQKSKKKHVTVTNLTVKDCEEKLGDELNWGESDPRNPVNWQHGLDSTVFDDGPISALEKQDEEDEDKWRLTIRPQPELERPRQTPVVVTRRAAPEYAPNDCGQSDTQESDMPPTPMTYYPLEKEEEEEELTLIQLDDERPPGIIHEPEFELFVEDDPFDPKAPWDILTDLGRRNFYEEEEDVSDEEMNGFF
jgi:hypothetical protein